MHPRQEKPQNVQHRPNRTIGNSGTVTIMPIDDEEAQIWDRIAEMKARGR